ncbi:hypothetical protein [Bacillus sp. UMB0728]|uniref:hypothetical protein n=1 Tax=Bacillus sp. UMB0728 TaxID=2066052 RepID=UPI000C75B168|nr:hypothetical protein [Bacillus sp. UMB0728]PLR71050.1 hypothetical protein CYJ37_19890 [Bacillus sp. UMB0728]
MPTEEIAKLLFLDQHEELLNIDGESGLEKNVREHVMEILTPLVDHVTVDSKDNILAQKKYQGGHGPVILLNAHLKPRGQTPWDVGPRDLSLWLATICLV